MKTVHALLSQVIAHEPDLATILNPKELEETAWQTFSSAAYEASKGEPISEPALRAAFQENAQALVIFIVEKLAHQLQEAVDVTAEAAGKSNHVARSRSAWLGHVNALKRAGNQLRSYFAKTAS